MDLAAFRTVVSSKIGMDNGAGSSDQLLIDRWVNEGVVEVLLRTHIRVTALAPAALTNGVSEYDLDTLASGTLAIHEAIRTVSGSDKRLNHVSLEEIVQIRTGNVVPATGTYFFALEGTSLFVTYPAPGAGETLTLYRVPRPTSMSTGTHDPSTLSFGGVPTEAHKAIEYWALAEAADFDDDTSSQQGMRYRALFFQEIEWLKQVVLVRGGRRPSLSALGGGKARPIPSEIPLMTHDPSIAVEQAPQQQG